MRVIRFPVAGALLAFVAIHLATTMPAWGRQRKVLAAVEFRDGYDGILERWVGEEAGSAPPALADLEARVLAGAAREDVLPSLAAEEVGRVRKASGGDGMAVVAAAALHEAVYPLHVAAGRPLLAAHTRRTVRALASLAVDVDDTAAIRRAAAGVLAGLGGRVHAAGQPGAARSVYEDALRTAPAQPGALFGLAVVEEKRGDYERTVDLLVAAHEAGVAGIDLELRLGVNLIRIGRRSEGREVLSWVIDRASDWRASVAATELARSLAAADLWTEAREVVSRVRTRRKCDAGLIIVAAWIGSRIDEPGGGAELVEELRRCAGPGEPAPRYLYNLAPTGLVEATRVHLDEITDSARGRLARSLEEKRNRWWRW